MIPGVPYDAEIEYLESTGTQWIDTGVAQSSTVSVSVDCLPTNGVISSGRFYSGPLFGNVSNSAYAFCFTAGVANDFFVCYSTVIIDLNKTERQLLTMTNSLGTRTINGNTQSWQLSGRTITGQSSMFLFARRTANAPFCGTWRIFRAKISEAGVLVRDFIPVRVGQVGYMYDRVSRKLFGNKGTGSFVLGPDVAKPVIGLWGMKKFYTLSDYNTDGLISMWDGEWNAGVNIHSDTAASWKNLVGTLDLPISSGGTWERDCLYCDGVNPGVAYRQTTGETSQITCPYYECVFQLVSYNRKTNYRVVHIRPNGNVNYEHAVGWGYASGKENSFVVNRRSNILNDTLRHSVTCNSVERNVVIASTFDNSAITYEGNFGAGSFRNGIYIGASARSNTPIWQMPCNCRVFSLRLYSRALSADEIAHNYQIDKARFNL